MVMSRWGEERQRELFVATDRVAKAPRHVFYERLNSLLREAGFDRWVEGLCEEFYSDRGRGSIPPVQARTRKDRPCGLVLEPSGCRRGIRVRFPDSPVATPVR